MQLEKLKKIRQLLNNKFHRSVIRLSENNTDWGKELCIIQLKQQFSEYITKELYVTERKSFDNTTELSLEAIVLTQEELREIILNYAEFCGGDVEHCKKIIR